MIVYEYSNGHRHGPAVLRSAFGGHTPLESQAGLSRASTLRFGANVQAAQHGTVQTDARADLAACGKRIDETGKKKNRKERMATSLPIERGSGSNREHPDYFTRVLHIALVLVFYRLLVCTIVFLALKLICAMCEETLRSDPGECDASAMLCDAMPCYAMPR